MSDVTTALNPEQGMARLREMRADVSAVGHHDIYS
jgi:hypothetical protein